MTTTPPTTPPESSDTVEETTPPEAVVEKEPEPATPPKTGMIPPPPITPMASPQSMPQQNKLLQWWVDLFQKISVLTILPLKDEPASKEEAKNRLRLVLMHDRTQLSPSLLESMRDELLKVIAKYVEIDQTTLDLSLEQESNTIALVANIAVIRAREGEGA